MGSTRRELLASLKLTVTEIICQNSVTAGNSKVKCAPYTEHSI